MSEPVHISKIIEELAEQYEWARGHNVTLIQRDMKADVVLRLAALKLKWGYDSMTVHVEALRELDKLAFNISDLRYYKMKLSKVTGVR
jgi:hypothetical protein